MDKRKFENDAIGLNHEGGLGPTGN